MTHGQTQIKSFRRPRRAWKNNIKMYLHELGLEGMDWIKLAQDKDKWRVFVNAVMNLRFYKMQGIS